MTTSAQTDTASSASDANEEALESYLLRLNGRAWGLALGCLSGLALFVATNWLYLKDGEEAGPHLGLLGQYFPGYSVTFVGSLIGFVYAFVVGYASGRLVCGVYNRAAR